MLAAGSEVIMRPNSAASMPCGSLTPFSMARKLFPSPRLALNRSVTAPSAPFASSGYLFADGESQLVQVRYLGASEQERLAGCSGRCRSAP